MMSALAFYATASVSFSAGLVFGAYWATRDKGAAESSRVSEATDWLYEAGRYDTAVWADRYKGVKPRGFWMCDGPLRFEEFARRAEGQL